MVLKHMQTVVEGILGRYLEELICDGFCREPGVHIGAVGTMANLHVPQAVELHKT